MVELIMAEKEKLMLVTCGISLFESASWTTGEWMKDIPEYENWLKEGTGENPGPLISPSRRIKDEKYSKIYSFFKSRLTANNAADWARHFAKDITPKPYTLRYSAELSSIFDFAMRETNSNWLEYLNKFEIEFITDAQESSLSYIAAIHNLYYLSFISGFKKDNLKKHTIPDLSNRDVDKLKIAFESLKYHFFEQYKKYQKTDYDEFVIIISGGYKIYPLAFSKIFCNEVEKKIKVVYRYEASDNLLLFEKGSDDEDMHLIDG